MGSVSVKENGVWRTLNNVKCKANGGWQQVKQIYVKVNGVWRQVWTWAVSASADIPSCGISGNDRGWPTHIKYGTFTSSFKTIPNTIATISYNILLGGSYETGDSYGDGDDYTTHHCSGKVICSFTGATVNSYSLGIFYHKNRSEKYGAPATVSYRPTSGKTSNSLWVNSDYTLPVHTYGDTRVWGSCTVVLSITADALTITHSGGEMFGISGTMQYIAPGV